jgi:hypothetical protein
MPRAGRRLRRALTRSDRWRQGWRQKSPSRSTAAARSASTGLPPTCGSAPSNERSAALRVSVGGDAASATSARRGRARRWRRGRHAAARRRGATGPRGARSRHSRGRGSRRVPIGHRRSAYRRNATAGARGSREAIGLHRLRDGSLACGIGLPSGMPMRQSLERLAEAAGRRCRRQRHARRSGRALMIIGLTHASVAPRSPPPPSGSALSCAPTIRAGMSSRVRARRSARPRTSPRAPSLR